MRHISVLTFCGHKWKKRKKWNGKSSSWLLHWRCQRLRIFSVDESCVNGYEFSVSMATDVSMLLKRKCRNHSHGFAVTWSVNTYIETWWGLYASVISGIIGSGDGLPSIWCHLRQTRSISQILIKIANVLINKWLSADVWQTVVMLLRPQGVKCCCCRH